MLKAFKLFIHDNYGEDRWFIVMACEMTIAINQVVEAVAKSHDVEPGDIQCRFAEWIEGEALVLDGPPELQVSPIDHHAE